MTAWKAIKEACTRGTVPGTNGRQAKLVVASQVFNNLEPYLKNYKREAADFGSDVELTAALLNYRTLVEMGLIKREEVER
jgi:hypothetical protein